MRSHEFGGWPQPSTYDDVKFPLFVPGLYKATPRRDCLVSVKAWAPGGGGGRSGARGGAGAFLHVSTILRANVEYWFIVGRGGYSAVPSTYSSVAYYGGGRSKSGNDDYPGAGGGLTGLFEGAIEQARALLVAGAGGGGGYSATTYDGGPGGILTGSPGGAPSNNAQGGTQTAGGAGATPGSGTGVAGSALAGGDGASNWGAGGGSGWFGGGGGNESPGLIRGGGGGSSWWHKTMVSILLAEAGSGTTPGNSTDPDRILSAGDGGAVATAGGNGLLVISGLRAATLTLAQAA